MMDSEANDQMALTYCDRASSCFFEEEPLEVRWKEASQYLASAQKTAVTDKVKAYVRERTEEMTVIFLLLSAQDKINQIERDLEGGACDMDRIRSQLEGEKRILQESSKLGRAEEIIVAR